MYFYVPSKGKPLISLTVSEDENMSFCYYKVPSAAYYYTPFAHTLPSAGVPKQQEETEAIANVSAEGKELQLIAAGKFKEANGWVPRELMFRTKMCSFFYHTGQCAKGDRCNFSHAFEPGMEVPPPPLPKPASNKFEHRSKPCKFFFIYGHCSKGEDCNFSHDPTIFLNKGSSKAQKENKLKRDSSAN